MDHSAVPQDRHVERGPVESDELRPVLRNPIDEGLDRFGLGSLGEVWSAERAHDPPGVEPLRDESADTDDPVKDELWEPIPELLASSCLVRLVKPVHTGDGGEVGYRFQVPDEKVI